MSSLKAFRSSFLDFIADPFYISELESARYIPDGLLVLEDGKIKEIGTYDSLQHKYPEISITAYPGMLIVPGFIDTHVHFPQLEIIAAYGEQLLTWLNKYTFPTEGKFKDKAYAQKVAAIFLDELLKNGTTTALVFATVHPESVDAFFEEANRRHLRAIAGKVMMDRNAPDFLTDTAETSYQETKALIQKWHKKDRLLYAVTPRFAITSTNEQLQIAGRLLKEFPDVYLHTHISENVDEVAFVKQLFPESQGYLDVYDRAGLVGDRSVFAHGVHLTDEEFQRLSQANAAIAFCPTSNLFLGSGLFRIGTAKSKDCPVKVGLGTDVGGGTSLSLLRTANEAYKIAQLRQQKLSPFQALFLATLGGAKALKLEDKIGNFDPGKEADFIVLDPRATPLMAFRNSDATPTSLEELAERIFTLVIMGDDRAIHATYIMGGLVMGNG
ncbi:MAG: Guanine deaminase [Chroococcidiopsis sp. SAG 2025]|uniref:guanine deaminase n=1 Tax=Chroococcidiopsis sp. SAG 2025 TaxID=171389 RepID=UPI00293739A1|nr:guanine deaminase [Chroococcidiopsis sp. SAG 2025]MDV2994115.1 Guanine deaminase [Chroococcidiopsis sp. SAG 2025]